MHEFITLSICFDMQIYVEQNLSTGQGQIETIQNWGKIGGGGQTVLKSKEVKGITHCYHLLLSFLFIYFFCRLKNVCVGGGVVLKYALYSLSRLIVMAS
jgi:hypothetical protein